MTEQGGTYHELRLTLAHVPEHLVVEITAIGQVGHEAVPNECGNIP